VTLPFGKYRGRCLDDVPASYLAWLFSEGDIRPDLRRAIRRELLNRLDGVPYEMAEAWRHGAPTLPSDPAVMAAVRQIVSSGYRAAALTHHPDRGGDHHLMVAATAARDWLTQAIGGAA
jgi:hypothetical protein